MRGIGVMVGAGALLAAGAIGLAITAGRRDDTDTPPSPRPMPRPEAGGIVWSPDALLPGVSKDGAAQADWAAAAIGRLDANGDRILQASDGASTGGAWGSDGPSHVVAALIDRYDSTGDGFLDAHEAALVGADVAVDGWLTSDAVHGLRRILGG